ncbi:PREDICTED: uncharacterized protein LOC105447805 [Wasmannia auropunctata]|uniref:uncharacterized protein LOC105447805 n=1 Tax=Wasmannia auropunctata TaxID=64793 RepID=UPI0005F05891|nr:PREDICTED: uncharacterized protein LOC105447805 [Wasmannia auropunctata]
MGNKGHKYKNIIAPLLPEDVKSGKKIGKGIPRTMTVNDSKIEYIHWDDPNELVDHLRLLEASRQAGHNAHNNETLSIIEELREAAGVCGYDDLWQADVVEMRPYMRFNRGYHYILTVIDVLSKHAWAIPLKVKSGSDVTKAIAEIIRHDGRCPKNLQTDREKEFYNANASVVERFNRTLKNSMWKQFTHNGNCRWIDLLPRLMSEYNARKHRTIGMRPIDVTPAIVNKLTTVYNRVEIAAPARFKVGDSVRVSKFKTIFEKGYTTNWTTEVFKIIKVQKTNPATYLLKDSRGKPIAGEFYEYELHRVANPDVYLVEKVLRKRGNEVYVKWLGLDDSHNSWIYKDNML